MSDAKKETLTINAVRDRMILHPRSLERSCGMLHLPGQKPVEFEGVLSCHTSDYYRSTISINTPHGKEVYNPERGAAVTFEFTGKLSGVTFLSSYFKSLVGADPEVFLVNGDGSLLPAFEVLPSKEKAAPFDAAYWDGYQAEFAVSPSHCIAYLADNIRSGLLDALRHARTTVPDAQLSTQTTFEIPAERLATDRREYVNFGCKPSLNVYKDFPRLPPGKFVPFRSTGGHLHMQYTESSPAWPDTYPEENIPVAIKELDRILGVISVSMFEHYDTPARREFYGRAGEYRRTPYGFEYRVLSSAWTIHPGLVHLVYEIARRCVGTTIPIGNWDVTEEEARTIINTCDVEAARAALLRNHDALMQLCREVPGNHNGTMRIIMEGAHKFLKTPDAYAAAWGLETGIWTTHSGQPRATWYGCSNAIAEGETI